MHTRERRTHMRVIEGYCFLGRLNQEEIISRCISLRDLRGLRAMGFVFGAENLRQFLEADLVTAWGSVSFDYDLGHIVSVMDLTSPFLPIFAYPLTGGWLSNEPVLLV